MPVAVSRRAWMIGGAVAIVVVLAVALIVVLNRGGGPDVRLSAPSYVADPVPKAKPLAARDVPKRCGVRTATVHRYADGRTDHYRHDQESGGVRCEWSAWGGAGRLRILDVEFGTVGPSPITEPGSADGDALRALDPADPDLVAAGDPARPIGGLGDEALYYYSSGLRAADPTTGRAKGLAGAVTDAGGGVLRFRTGATFVTVAYGGADRTGKGTVRQVADGDVRSSVFAAAADVAAALHVPGKPTGGTTSAAAVTPAAVSRTVRPCDLLPQDVADRLADGATRERPYLEADILQRAAGSYGMTGDSCQWQATADPDEHRPGRTLTVAVVTEPEWRRGIGAAQAGRLYLERHDDARAARPAGFHAVGGLGDQAYAAYPDPSDTSDTGTGTVAFRYRNRVVEVGYAGDADHPLDARTAIDGAYTAATAVLEALR